MDKKKKNLAVFVSGTGSNFTAIHENILNKKINGNIKILISNRDDSKAIQKAIGYGIGYKILNKKKFTSSEEYSKALLETLKEYNIDYILLAGYLQKIPSNIVTVYKNKILNIHPALLPKYGGERMYGIHVHEAVINAKEKETGVTIHFIDEKYDCGSIIMQEKIPVYETDIPEVLQKRVLQTEHKLYSHVVQLLCDDKIKIIDNKIIIEGE